MTPLATDAHLALVHLDKIADSIDSMAGVLANLAHALDARGMADLAQYASDLGTDCHTRSAQLRVQRHNLVRNSIIGGRA